VLDLSQLQPEDVSVRMKAARELRGLSQSALGLLFEEDGLGKTDPGRIERMDPKVPFRRGPHCCPRPRSLQRSGTVYEIPSSPAPRVGPCSAHHPPRAAGVGGMEQPTPRLGWNLFEHMFLSAICDQAVCKPHCTHHLNTGG
jgi:hypothetical protein